MFISGLSVTSGVAGYVSRFSITPADATAYLGSSNATALTFLTNNLARVKIDTTGNVGIGTTSPASVLNVYSASGNSGSIEALIPLIAVAVIVLTET